MKYMGSKARIAKYILPIMLENRTDNQWYIEPFVGGCNTIDSVDGRRVGNDIHTYLIHFYKALQAGWIPPAHVTEEHYNDLKNYKEYNDPRLVGYVGFQLSYGGKWFGGYRRDSIGKRDYAVEAYNHVLNQRPKLKDIVFTNVSYMEMDFPKNSLIYCDPPYSSVTKYSMNFDHIVFWEWVRELGRVGYTVFVSEYAAPDDFICVWQRSLTSSLTKNTGAKIGIEKLFRWDATI